MFRIAALVCVLCAGVFLSGCATIVSGNETTTQIETDPEKARCELQGDEFKQVVETPDSVHLSAKAAPISIHCVTDGYHEAAAELDTRADGTFMGNILIGGIFGLVVDAATQSGMKYPSKILIALDPKGFKTGAARDAWYERRRQFTEKKWMEEFLASSHSVDCDTDSEAAKRQCFDKYASDVHKTARDDMLEDLKRKYHTAQIGGVAGKPVRTVAATGSPTTSPPAASPKNSKARVERDVRQRFERLIAARRKERYVLACDESMKKARTEACRDVAFQIQLLQEAEQKELANLTMNAGHSAGMAAPTRSGPNGSAAAPAPKKSREEVERDRRRQIAAIKAQSPSEECGLWLPDSAGRDPVSYAECEEREEQIKLLESQIKNATRREQRVKLDEPKQQTLTNLPAHSTPAKPVQPVAKAAALQKECRVEDKIDFSRENVAIKAAIRNFAFVQGIGEPNPSRSITKFMSLTPKNVTCGAIEVRAAVVVPVFHGASRDTDQIHNFYLEKEGREYRVVRCGSC